MFSERKTKKPMNVIEDKNSLENNPVVIIIGFNYKKKCLPTTKKDIDNVMNWCKENKYDYSILSDVEYSESKNNIYMINTKSDFISSITKTMNNFSGKNKIIVYYTGHGSENYFKLPDDTKISSLDFRNIFLGNPLSEIFFIIDCCNPSNLCLPFKLKSNRFALIKDDSTSPVQQKVFLITSSRPVEKAVAHKEKGSLFTKNLLDLLRELSDGFNPPNFNKNIKNLKFKNQYNRNLERLVYKLNNKIKNQNNSGHNQSVCFYSSHATHPILWLWIGSPENFDIIPSENFENLIVRNHKSSYPSKNVTYISSNSSFLKYQDLDSPTKFKDIFSSLSIENPYPD